MRRLFASLPFAIHTACAVVAASPAMAADGQIVITQQKAMAGNVTSGDTAGFPVTLSNPGSYTLGSDLIPGPGRDGIVAMSADVAIDLNGFRLSGGAAGGGAGNSRHGIVGQGDRLTVKNGTIGGFNGTGILAPNRPYLVIEGLRVINNGSGINNTNGNVARIQNSTIATNRGVAVICGGSCQVSQNVIASNASAAIVCSVACHLESNVISFNGHPQGAALYMGTGSALGNTIVSNPGYAIWVTVANDNVGIGNNTIADNNRGGKQLNGSFIKLFPNACTPTFC